LRSRRHLVGRDTERLPDLSRAGRRGPAAYADEPAMRAALEGATTLVLVSGRPTGRRLEEHSTAITAAMAVGVQRVVYVSLLGAAPAATYRNARDHWLTERFLAVSGVRHTIVRAGIYASTPAALADEHLVVRGPGGDGRAAFVAHEDIAAVVCAVVLDEAGTEHDGAILEVTGPEAISLEEAVAQIALATGRPTATKPRRSRLRSIGAGGWG
jgi:NAD(P)H dehydrogenase (quinone)